MKKLSRIVYVTLMIFIFACPKNGNKNINKRSSIDIKIDSAVLLIYKIYSGCETTILENNNGKIDTVAKNISYLCLPVKIIPPDIHGDTTLITIFFRPERGYEVEDPKCNFAYSVGFVGPDNYYDFVEFGDNYYSINSLQLKKSNPQMELIFIEKTSRLNCITDQLKRLLNSQK